MNDNDKTNGKLKIASTLGLIELHKNFLKYIKKKTPIDTDQEIPDYILDKYILGKDTPLNISQEKLEDFIPPVIWGNQSLHATLNGDEIFTLNGFPYKSKNPNEYIKYASGGNLSSKQILFSSKDHKAMSIKEMQEHAQEKLNGTGKSR